MLGSPFPKSHGLHFVDACIRSEFHCEGGGGDRMLGRQSTDLLAIKPENVEAKYFVCSLIYTVWTIGGRSGSVLSEFYSVL